MPNQYTKLTKSNILTKVTRKRSPVQSMAQLAREFGYNTHSFRADGTWSISAPGSFRNRVRALVGEDTYKTIRDGRFANKS